MTQAQSIRTQLGPGSKRTQGTDSEIAGRFAAIDFDEVRARFGFDSAPPEWMDAAIALLKVSAEHSVLVPCAGQGWMADRLLARLGANGLRVLEVQEREPALRELLSVKGYRLSDLEDLLASEALDSYDRILVFPPHHRGREADYLRQCYRLLSPGGRLCAIVSDSVFFHSRPECLRFRELFRALRRLGRAGYERLEDEEQGGSDKATDQGSKPEDSDKLSPEPPFPDPTPENSAPKPTGQPQSPKSDKGDDDGEGGMAFETRASGGLASPFFSPLALPPVQKAHRPDPGQGRFWRLVWMERGPEPYEKEQLDDHAAFAPDAEPLLLSRMQSRSIKPAVKPVPVSLPAQGGLQPGGPLPQTNPAQPGGTAPEDTEAEIELELELIRMRVGRGSTLSGLDRKRLGLAKARLKLKDVCIKPKK